YAAQRGPRFDTRFALAAIRDIKKYKLKYILADRAYDTEPIRKCINEEAKAEDQIPLKTRAKTGHYRLKSKKQFNQEIYSRRNNVESIFSVIKKYSTEQTEAEAYNYQIKKQNSKIQSTTSIDQLKFNKNEDFYKA
ncbi:transposase, partial [Methanobrevibacter sp.]